MGVIGSDQGRCFGFVDDPDGKPVNCPDIVIASGWLKVGDTWHEVDACGRHSAQLRSRGRR